MRASFAAVVLSAAVAIATVTVTVNVVIAASGCATSTQPSHAEVTRIRLEQFSSSLAHAGMSVPVPPRVCDEPLRGDAVTFDDDVGCVSVPDNAPVDDAVRIYARAIVQRRVPGAPEMRADLLVDAWRNDDPAFASMASSIESEFDARRAALKSRKAGGAGGRADKALAAKARARPDKKRDVVDAGVARAPSSRARTERGDHVDARDGGVELGLIDLVDAGPRKRTVKERIIGTWVMVKDGASVTAVHALCASGAWVVRYEASSDVGRSIAGEVPPMRGTWEVTEPSGDDDDEDPVLTLILNDGERQEGPITELSEDSAEVTLDGEQLSFRRRSKSANCD